MPHPAKRKHIDRKIELLNEYRRLNASAWYIATRLDAKFKSDPKTYSRQCLQANAIYSFTLDRLASFRSDPQKAIALLDTYALSPTSELIAFCASLEY